MASTYPGGLPSLPPLPPCLPAAAAATAARADPADPAGADSAEVKSGGAAPVVALTADEKDHVLAALLRTHPQLVGAAVGRVRQESGAAASAAGNSRQRRPKANTSKRSPPATKAAGGRPASVSTAAPPSFKSLVPKGDLWDHRYAQLVSYRAEHGDCRVPYKYAPDPALWRWVDNQRQAYRWRAEGKPGSWLTDARVDRLDAIGFVWNVRDARQLTFEERLEQLRQFKATHDGSLNVPLRDPSGLGRWVSSQRSRRDVMDASRVAALDAVGFHWEVRKPKKSWEERVDELRAYRARHGHCNVRNAHGDGELYRWTRGLRSRYRARMAMGMDGDGGGGTGTDGAATGKKKNEGGAQGLGDERIGELVLLGFDFNAAPDETRATNKTWEEQYEELRKFKDKYGHCCPRKCPEADKYEDLCKWTWHQRYEYQKWKAQVAGDGSGRTVNDDNDGRKGEGGGEEGKDKKGRQSKMTEERAAKLESLDFLRKVYKKGGRYFVKVDGAGGDGEELQELMVGTAVADDGSNEKTKKKKKKKKEKKRKKGDDDGEGLEQEAETEQKSPPPKKKQRKNATNTNTSAKKAAHVKWDGKTIALGTFPAPEAEEKCTRARELTAVWRKEKDPQMSREWVIAELERLGVRVVVTSVRVGLVEV